MVPFLPIRKGPNFANPEGSCFCQSGRVLFLPFRRGPFFANPEGSYFCQSRGVLFLSIRRGLVFELRKTDLRKKLGGTYKREHFLILEKKDVLVNNFRTTGQIQLILVPLD